MAHTLGIGIAGASYSLSTTNAMLVNYGMTPAAFAAVEENPESVTAVDNIELMIYGGTTAAMMDVYEQIERYLMLARRRQSTGTGDKIYVFLQLDGEDSYRSEIISGFVRPNSDSLKAFGGAQMPVTLVIERRGYWEQSTAQTAKSSTAITNIGNANYVDISSSAVDGSLPTPAIIDYENSSGAARYYTNIWMWNNAFADPANFTGYLVGTDLSGGDDIISFTADVDAEEYWSLSDAFLADTNGANFRILGSFSDVPTVGGYWEMFLKYNTLFEMNSAGEVYDLVVGMTDFGVLPFPPGGYGVGNSDFELYIGVRNTTTDTATCDFVQLAPADNVRHLYQLGFGVPNGASVVEDGVAGTAYIENGSDKYPILVPRGKPVMLWPGQTQRLHVQVDGTGYSTAWTANLTVTYRGRKVTL